MVVERLGLCREIDLNEDVRLHGVDLYKTLSVYNLHHWFDGRIAKIVLDLDIPVVALVSISGIARIYASGCSGIDAYVAKVYRALGINEDLTGFFSTASRDPLLSRFAAEWYGWRLRSTNLWWALVIGVCQQNASFRQGWFMVMNVVDLYGRCVELEDYGLVVLPPHPIDILRDSQKLVNARVGYRAQTIVGIAKAFNEGAIPDERDLGKMDSHEIEEILRRLKGVGSYTARLAMVLALRRYDLPPLDRWLRTIASKVYGVDERRAEDVWREVWGRWSGLAAVALTVALDAAPLREALNRIERGELVPRVDDYPSPANLWRFRSLSRKHAK